MESVGQGLGEATQSQCGSGGIHRQPQRQRLLTDCWWTCCILVHYLNIPSPHPQVSPLLFVPLDEKGLNVVPQLPNLYINKIL